MRFVALVGLTACATTAAIRGGETATPNAAEIRRHVLPAGGTFDFATGQAVLPK